MTDKQETVDYARGILNHVTGAGLTPRRRATDKLKAETAILTLEQADALAALEETLNEARRVIRTVTDAAAPFYAIDDVWDALSKFKKSLGVEVKKP